MGYKFLNKGPLEALDGKTAIEIGKEFDKVYQNIGGEGLGPKIYKALISQNAPIASQTSGTFTVGQIWTINTYFSGVALTKSGLVGGTGYTTDTGVTTSGGTGTGLLVDYTAVAGAITSLTIADGGSGYTVGDVITVDGGGDNATFVVASIGSDDFSNMELISGTMNTDGAVIRATSTTPTTWTQGSDLSYDGAPYVVSTDSNGNLSPFVNTIGDITFSYAGQGDYRINCSGAFPTNKVFTIINNNYGTRAVEYNFDQYDTSNVRLATIDTATDLLADNFLIATPITIEVYP